MDFLARAKRLETIDVHSNQIRDLSSIRNLIKKRGIKDASWQTGTISIAKNPLEKPPMQIVQLGKNAVLEVFEDLETEGEYINTDIKVILIGNSETGKSTLAKYMDEEKDLTSSHSSTLWMDEKIVKSKYKVEKIGEICRLHLFDFGGHDYYHDTHHLFFGTNTAYILLWEATTNNLKTRVLSQKNSRGETVTVETQDYPLDYWLESVKFYTQEPDADNFGFKISKDRTYNSPLIVIQNKVSSGSQTFFLNNRLYHEKYPFIYDFINISIINPRRNLDHFDQIFLEMLSEMQFVGAVLPSFYGPVIAAVNGYHGKPALTPSEFLKFCNSQVAKNIRPKQARTLIAYLEQIGLIVRTKASAGKIFVDKKWLIKQIHAVLIDLQIRKGEFDLKYLSERLDDSAGDTGDILAIMSEFKMIVKHPEKEVYIAPLYLPSIPQSSVSIFLSKGDVPYRRFEYRGFIPKNVVLNFFNKYSGTIKGDKNTGAYYYWKDALILKKALTEEIIMIKFDIGNDNGFAFIDIFQLNVRPETVFLEEILDFMQELNKEYDTEEMVTLDGKTFMSVPLLTENAKKGKLVFSEQRLEEQFKISDQEENVFKLKDFQKFLKDEIKKKKVVISYSKKDLANVHTLKRYLRPLVDAELIEEPWYCTSLLPGESWEEKIKHKFDEADMVIFMVSEYFYNTSYIVDHEIKNAIDKYDNDRSVKIVPIILEFYDWARKEPYNLQRFSALPFQAKPISDYRNPKMAWNTITTSIKMMIEKDLDPGKTEAISRELQEIYERQVNGKIDNNN